jgi:hypothetical protein
LTGNPQILFLHANFPAQFRHEVAAIAKDYPELMNSVSEFFLPVTIANRK